MRNSINPVSESDYRIHWDILSWWTNKLLSRNSAEGHSYRQVCTYLHIFTDLFHHHLNVTIFLFRVSSTWLRNIFDHRLVSPSYMQVCTGRPKYFYLWTCFPIILTRLFLFSGYRVPDWAQPSTRHSRWCGPLLVPRGRPQQDSHRRLPGREVTLARHHQLVGHHLGMFKSVWAVG